MKQLRLRKGSREFFHIARKKDIPDILRDGLLPRIGFIARGVGEDTYAVHVYTSSARVRDELVQSGWYRQAIEATYGEEELCVLRVMLHPDSCATMAGADNECLRVLTPIPTSSIVVLDTNLHPVPAAELVAMQRIAANVFEGELPL